MLSELLETVIRLLDELDDIVATIVFRLQRALHRTPRERRSRPRLDSVATRQPRLTELSLQQ